MTSVIKGNDYYLVLQILTLTILLATMKNIKTFLAGLGTVNRGFLEILIRKKKEIESTGIHFTISGVADSSGAAVKEDGFRPEELLSLKRMNRKTVHLSPYATGSSIQNILQKNHFDLLVESTPGNLISGNPGLDIATTALQKKTHVVLANKAPLIFAYDELHHIAKERNVRLAFSATVCGGLPVINVLQRDLKTASLKSLRGIFNATSNYVLQHMEEGGSLEEAIAEAQRLGAAETDPSHDIEGHDSANKLFIIMKAFTDFNGSIDEVEVAGIEAIKAETIRKAKGNDKIIKLVASAFRQNEQWILEVKPIELDARSFLANCNGWEMGLEIETDLYEKISMKNYEADPVGTSAAVLRDAMEIFK